MSKKLCGCLTVNVCHGWLVKVILHLSSSGALLTGNYGLWNAYVLLMMFLYAPSHAGELAQVSLLTSDTGRIIIAEPFFSTFGNFFSHIQTV